VEFASLSLERRQHPRLFPGGDYLFDDLRHHAGTDRSATFADGEADALVHGDRGD